MKLEGVYVLACKNPPSLYVIVPHPDEFPPGYATRVKSALLTSFKEKKFDDGLQKVIDMTLDAKGLGAKKD